MRFQRIPALNCPHNIIVLRIMHDILHLGEQQSRLLLCTYAAGHQLKNHYGYWTIITCPCCRKHVLSYPLCTAGRSGTIFRKTHVARRIADGGKKKCQFCSAYIFTPPPPPPRRNPTRRRTRLGDNYTSICTYAFAHYRNDILSYACVRCI